MFYSFEILIYFCFVAAGTWSTSSISKHAQVQNTYKEQET